MNEEQQRIAIALSQGLTDEEWIYANGELCFSLLVPDYIYDLSAMYEVWQTLTSDQKITYRGELAKICAREAPERDTCWLEDIAAEFAPEAFLKTLGLWEEGE